MDRARRRRDIALPKHRFHADRIVQQWRQHPGGGSVSITNTGAAGDGWPDGGNFLGIPTDTLLLGATIFDFSIEKLNDTSGTFFFRLSSTSSGAATELGWDVPANGQIILNATGLDTGWDSGTVAFTGSGNADVGVPSPGTIALLGAGLLGLQRLRTRVSFRHRRFGFGAPG
ncbi:MAG: hypothetical protein LJE69_04300 [Thiohalocapsa sp.]|uniref:hypothetical protein n=1 Tax=Thiohalocapsa sp. TaxID=2497641 RepID=UPI0025E34EB4|nr:hypothetical protein [Thiohalocapsa sp.]MCG6940455.1 hypothetical protein [Thiohalocapsa sp.]